jgi:hypothetical protein
MLGILVLIALGVGAWWTFSPGRPFLKGFAALLDDARTHWGFEGGAFVTFVAGRYRRRAVMLQLFHPTGGDGGSFNPGKLVLTMETRARERSAWKNSLATFNNPDLARATFDLEGRYGLILAMGDGSLNAAWTSAPGRSFPGRFDEDRWRNTLAQMRVLVEWLEGAAGEIG